LPEYLRLAAKFFLVLLPLVLIADFGRGFRLAGASLALVLAFAAILVAFIWQPKR
jgi:hypothetical protein